MNDISQDDAKKKLWSMIKDVRFAMLTTEDGGNLRARPMVAVQKDFDGTLWFFTRASSHKVNEVQSDERVGVTYADPGQQNYVSMSGHAKLVRDKQAIDEHWAESLRTWFPGGQGRSGGGAAQGGCGAPPSIGMRRTARWCTPMAM